MDVSGVHLLGAGQLARQGVDREHGQLARGERLHEFGVLRGPDEAHQRAARPHQRDLVGRRARTLKIRSDPA